MGRSGQADQEVGAVEMGHGEVGPMQAKRGRERKKRKAGASLLYFYILLFSLPFIFPTSSNRIPY